MAEPDKPWTPKIRNTKKLRIRNQAEVGLWTGVVAQAVPIFNNLAAKTMEYELVAEGKADVVVKIAGSGKHDPKFGENAVHGKIFYGNGLKGLEECEIFLPGSISHHGNILMLILLHEMAHAVGLVEHANDGILMNVPNIEGNLVSATPNSKKMPPYFVSGKTLVRMKKIW